MKNILHKIVSDAINACILIDKKVTFTTHVNEATLKEMSKELDNYHKYNDNLIISNKPDDWYTFEWECDNELQDNIYTITWK